ncbi:TPR-like protein [Backusella circina FSU 941]|nr:TPR-like protein [Backusella circina FSU 941]
MILTEDSIKTFKEQLQQSILVCSDRCLYQAAKWSAEVLDGIKPTSINNSDNSYTQSDFTLPCTSTYRTNYEASLGALTELEYNKYQYAKALFSIKQFDAVSFVLDGFEAPKLLFLKLYAQYLAGEKRQQEHTQEILGESEQTAAENEELDSVYNELYKRYEEDQLDAFGLYLYGVVLKRRNALQQAVTALLKSLLKYQFNWSTWMELATLVFDTVMFENIQALLNRTREFDNSIMKEFFLAKVSLKLYQNPNPTFRTVMNPINDHFASSTYVLSEWATYHYNNKEYNESAALFEDLRRRNPYRLEDMDTYSNLLYIQESKVKLCVLTLDCEKIDKFRPETCCVRANYHGVKGELHESVKYFKKALKLDRNYHQAWTLLGHEYIELKNTKAAVECYRRAIAMDNQDYRAWHGLGQAYEIMKSSEKALYYYEKAKNLQPNDARMWLVLQNCYAALQRNEEARECEIEAAACERKNELLAAIQLGRTFEKAGKTIEAMENYHMVWEHTKNNVITDDVADISLRLAKYFISEGHYNEAEKYVHTGLNAHHPYHEEARALLNEIHRHRELASVNN